jgi:hypothetical protein
MDSRDKDSPAARLAFARLSAGFETARAFSDRHKIPQATYHNHESGGRGIKDKTARKYAKLLGNCDYRWIMTGLGRAPEQPRGSVPALPASDGRGTEELPISIRLTSAIPGASSSPDGAAAIRFLQGNQVHLMIEMSWDALFELEAQIRKLPRPST